MKNNWYKVAGDLLQLVDHGNISQLRVGTLHNCSWFSEFLDNFVFYVSLNFSLSQWGFFIGHLLPVLLIEFWGMWRTDNLSI